MPCASIAMPVDDVELAGRRSASEPHDLMNLPFLSNFAIRDVAEAVGHVDVAGRVPRDVGRPVEDVLLRRPRPEDRRVRGHRRRRLGRRAAARRRRRRGAARPPPAPPRRRLQPARRRRRGDAAQRRNAFRLRLAAEQHLHRPFGIELDDHARHLIDDPDVVLRIDAHLLREQEAVRRPGRSRGRTCRS